MGIVICSCARGISFQFCMHVSSPYKENEQRLMAAKRPAKVAYLHALLTGPPGIGKTTLIKQVCLNLEKHRDNIDMSGFYTEEVREGGRGRGVRIGFDVVTLNGERGVLARVPCSSEGSSATSMSSRKPIFVGKYQVNVTSFEQLALPTLQLSGKRESKTGSTSSLLTGNSDERKISPASASQQSSSGAKSRLLVIDEIGKMELFSQNFVDAVKRLFEQQDNLVVLATIPVAKHKSHWLVEELRQHPNCQVFEVSERNRDGLVEDVTHFILKRLLIH